MTLVPFEEAACARNLRKSRRSFGKIVYPVALLSLCFDSSSGYGRCELLSEFPLLTLLSVA